MTASPTTAPTSTGLAPNIAALLAYVLGPITGVIFLVLEKENRFVRFHAAQSIAVGVALIIASIVLSVLSSILAFVPILGWIIALIGWMGLAFLSIVLWLLLMFKAYQGKEWQVPLVGTYARRYAEGARSVA